MNYDYHVKFELSEMSRIIRLAKSIKCEHIRMQILEPKNQPQDASSHRWFFLIQIYGDTSSDEKVFCSSTDSSKGNARNTLVVKNLEGDLTEADDPMNYRLDDLDRKYNGVFTVEYISRFIKSMDKHMINLTFAQDMPLILTCSLGDEYSFLAFVLAARENDDEIPNHIISFAD